MISAGKYTPVPSHHPQQLITHQEIQTQAQIQKLMALGMTYKQEQQYSRAFPFFQKAADLGHPAAKSEVGTMYRHGQGVEQDYVKAIGYFKDAADLDDADAMFNLSGMYARALGTEKDASLAFKYAEQGSQKKHPGALFNLGTFYADGSGTQYDHEKALSCFEEAARLDDPDAMCYLGCTYSIGLLGVEKDPFKAIEWFEKGAEKDHPMSITNLGKSYLGIDDCKAVQILTRAANLNDTNAILVLGVLSFERAIKTKKPAEKQALFEMAAYWYSKGSELKDPRAIQQLDEMKQQGLGYW